MRLSDPGAPARHGHGARHALARVPDAARRQLRARRLQTGAAGLRHRRAAPGEKTLPEVIATGARSVPADGGDDGRTHAPPFSLSSLTAFSFMISGRTSALIGSFSKSSSQRSGEITGLSVPNRTLCLSSVLAYCTSCGGKYFGDQPDRSM